MAKIRFENGTVVNFEGTPTPQDVEEIAQKLNIKKTPTTIQEKKDALIAQGKPVSVKDNRVEPTFLGNIVRAPLKTAARVGESLNRIAGGALGLVTGDKAKVDEALSPAPAKSSYLGNIYPVGNGVDENGQATNASNNFVKSAKDAVGVGFDIASYLEGGGAVKNIAKDAIEQTGKLAVKKILAGTLESGASGFLAGTSQALQEDMNLKDSAKTIGMSTLLGLGLGFTGSTVSAGANKVVNKIRMPVLEKVSIAAQKNGDAFRNAVDPNKSTVVKVIDKYAGKNDIFHDIAKENPTLQVLKGSEGRVDVEPYIRKTEQKISDISDKLTAEFQNNPKDVSWADIKSKALNSLDNSGLTGSELKAAKNKLDSEFDDLIEQHGPIIDTPIAQVEKKKLNQRKVAYNEPDASIKTKVNTSLLDGFRDVIEKAYDVKGQPNPVRIVNHETQKLIQQNQLLQAIDEKVITNPTRKFFNNENRPFTSRLLKTIAEQPVIGPFIKHFVADPNLFTGAARKVLVKNAGLTGKEASDLLEKSLMEIRGSAKKGFTDLVDNPNLLQKAYRNVVLNQSAKPTSTATTITAQKINSKKVNMDGIIPPINKNTSGMAEVKPLIKVAGTTLAGATIAANIKSKKAESLQIKEAPTLKVEVLENRADGTKVYKYDGVEVSDMHPKVAKEIPSVYENNPELPKGVLEALLMQESSAGYNNTNRNPKIGNYAWLGGMTKIARKELERLGNKVNLNTINGTLDAMAKLWIEKSKGKDVKETYKDEYSSGKLSDDTYNNFIKIYDYYSKQNNG